MKYTYPLIIGSLLFITLASPTLAQEGDEFFEAMRSNLTEQETVSIESPELTQKIQIERSPIIGESVSLEAVTPARAIDGSSQPYDAGRDRLSGSIAAGAVLLGVFIIIFLFAIVTSSKNSDSTS